MGLDEPVQLGSVRGVILGDGQVDDDLAAKSLIGTEQIRHAALRGGRVVEEQCPAVVAEVVRPVGKRHAADVVGRIVPPEIGIRAVVEQGQTVLADHRDVRLAKDRDERSRGARFRPGDTYQAACRGKELLHRRDGVRRVASRVDRDALDLVAEDSAGLIDHPRRGVAAGCGCDPVDGVRPGEGLDHAYRQGPARGTSVRARSARGHGQRERNCEHYRAELTARPAPCRRSGSAAIPGSGRRPTPVHHAGLPCPRPGWSADSWAVKDVDFPVLATTRQLRGRPAPEDQLPIDVCRQ